MSIVATKIVKTDAFAGLSLDNITYSSCDLSWINVSASSATFRIVSDDFVSEDVIVPGGEKGIYKVTDLVPGTTQNFYLQRFEIDEYVQQTSSSSGIDYVAVSTYSTKLSISTGSSAAKISWSNPGVSDSTEYIVKYNDMEVSASGTSHIVSGLEDGVEYTLSLSVVENGNTILLDTQVFTTSSNVAMEILNVFASYVELDWGDSVDGNSINYRIVSRTEDGDDVLVENTEKTEAVIRELNPGTTYTFVLQRLEIDGSWEDQNSVIVTTLTNSISVGSLASRSMMVSWSNMYSGAVYELFYNGKSAGQTTKTEISLKDLESDTEYELELAVIELGETVGLAKLGIQTNQKFLSVSNTPLVTGLLLAILIAILFMKMRK